MGEHLRSKTKQLVRRGGLEQTLFALRAWMIHRSEYNDWHARVPARLHWFEDERRSLKRDLQGQVLLLPTLNAIRQWAPAVLP